MVIVESYYLYPEKTVYDALQRIETRLENKEDIPFYNYGRLVVSLIKLKTVIAFDYAVCKQRMIENIEMVFVKGDHKWYLDPTSYENPVFTDNK